MKHSKISYIIFSIVLASCCSTVDSRVAKGYPYGDVLELNYTEFKGPWCGPGNVFFIPIVKDKATCDSLGLCDCSKMDFDKYILVHISGHIQRPYCTEYGYSVRALINHKAKKCTVELRGWYQTCGEDPTNIDGYEKTLIIPKPPSDYSINIEKISPVI